MKEAAEGNISEGAMAFVNYFIDTYVGRPRRGGGRSNPPIKPVFWSQFRNIIEGLPHTSNSVEAWNQVWNNANPFTKKMWTTVENLRGEEEITRAKWRQFIQTRDQDTVAAPVGARQAKVRSKMQALQRIASTYFHIVDKSEFIKQIDSVLS